MILPKCYQSHKSSFSEQIYKRFLLSGGTLKTHRSQTIEKHAIIRFSIFFLLTHFGRYKVWWRKGDELLEMEMDM